MKIDELIESGKRKYWNFREWFYHVKRKRCGFCKHARPFMGSAVICSAKKGCAAKNMRDMFDTCDCKSFKPICWW